jgi:hypothetical protein
MVPSESSLVKGTMPLAMNVFATGILSTSAKLTSESAAPWRITPLPARMTGFFALAMIFAAWSTFASGGTGLYAVCTGIGFLSVFISAMFSGKSMKAGAGLLGLRDLERLAHDLGRDLRHEDLRAVLGDRLEHVHQVEDLVALLVQARRGALPRDGDDGRAVHVRVRDTR